MSSEGLRVLNVALGDGGGGVAEETLPIVEANHGRSFALADFILDDVDHSLADIRDDRVGGTDIDTHNSGAARSHDVGGGWTG